VCVCVVFLLHTHALNDGGEDSDGGHDENEKTKKSSLLLFEKFDLPIPKKRLFVIGC
jgi:hypothetical protein